LFRAFSCVSCLILIGAFLAGGATSIDYCEAAEPKQKCLLIEHVTSAHGTVSTYVTADAVKVVFLNIHGYLIALAPSWKVVLVNTDEKLIYEDDYNHWINRLISYSYMGGTGDQCGYVLRKAGKKHYAGRECSLYTTGSTSALASYVVIEPTVVPAQGCRVLEKWFGTPFMDAVPVAYHWEHNGISQSVENRRSKPTNSVFNDHIDSLQTRSIKDTECPRDFFSYPSGLKKVHSEFDIFATKKRTKELEDALQDLGPR
jgi:hypothetical protein